MCADIVIVGAGPVGLWTAIQIKKRSPDIDIKIYERHSEYQRSHVLKLEHLSMLLYGKNSHDKHEKAFLEEVTGKKLNQVFQAAASRDSLFIRTHDLEKALKAYANSLGVNIANKKIDSPEDLEKTHPECKTFIASDGAHSTMRTSLMGEQSVKDFPLQYVVELKYEAQGHAGKLSNKEVHKTNEKLSSMAFEYVGKEKNGLTPVSLRFFIDKETYESLPQASFKAPLKIQDKGIPNNLSQDIKTYIDMRKTKAGEHFLEGSEKISKLTLSLYKAKHFAIKSKNNKNWFLVGDAAMGVPYFRSLNAGMIIGSQLGFILTRKHLSDGNKIRSYNAVSPLDTTWEFTAARGKNMALKTYDKFLNVTRKLPWKK